MRSGKKEYFRVGNANQNRRKASKNKKNGGNGNRIITANK